MKRLSLLAALLFASCIAMAQNNAVRGGIGGVVQDPSGAVIPGATVTIVGPQGTVETRTDGTGTFSVTGLTPGFYKVTVASPGFKNYVSGRNEVVVDHTSNLSVSMTLGDSGQTVTVEGGMVQLDTEDTSLNNAITDTFYNAVPVARAVSSAFYMAPGVVSGGGTGVSNPSIGGATGLENLYIADGVTITDQAFGGLGVYNVNYGSLGSGINLAFIKEVDVKTGAFEPRYGRADGGIVEILTKSGSNTLHGALSAYFSPAFAFADRRQPYQSNFVKASPASVESTPAYEISAEVGGHIIHDKLFYFGAFDPTLRQSLQVADPTAGLFSHGQFDYNTTSSSYAGKLTYAFRANTTLELSTYGDPSRRNGNPETLSATNALSVASAYQFGTRNTVLHANTVLSPSWTASGAYYYNFSKFREQLSLNDYAISDRTVSPFVTYGFGSYYPTKDLDYSLQFETEKTVHLFGDHTFQFGYLYDHTNFENSTLRSGASFAIPAQNAAGQTLTDLFSNIPANAVGASTNATFRLFNADPSCVQCALYNGKKVYLQEYRGTYKGSSVLAKARYQVLYGNDTYKINRYITADLGLRWEQQHYEGTVLNYLFNDNWSPRLGAIIDPFGDHKTKAFFNYARYQNVLPLDAAIRQLGNEQDDTSYYFTPKADASGNAIRDATGAVIPVLDSAHTLNGLPGKKATAKFGAPSFSSSTGEGILPGTRMEYENEYVLGVERQVSTGSVFKIRYMDRRLGRIVEDNGSQSPEGSLVDANYAGGIANITKAADFFTNEQEVVYTDAQFMAANGAGSNPGSVTADNYVAPVPGCTYSNDTSVANGDYFRHYDGTAFPGACITNADTAGTLGPDGKSDGFAKPIRHYQALEVEFNRNLTNHWQARVNYRYAKLFGNYEGFYRNDNGQSDPGISSLFDFTTGQLGLLGDQFTPGYLNTDRRHVANALLSYTVGSDTAYLGRLRGVTVGTWLHASTGSPLSAYESHPIYQNAGEVPVGGRGTKGSLPTTVQLDLHADAPIHLGEKYTVKLTFDSFNVTNSQFVTGRNQNLDTAPGTSNPDYNKNSSWQGPFYARGSVVFQF
ncbi:MAG TPA: carboxypeptidase regulatory-like domain-containing protein [Acidisarcina sp.]